MPKVSPIQGNFSGGEISPLFYGRVDSERYKVGLATCQNYIPTIQGGLARRPGTNFIAETKNSALPSRLIDFEYSVEQAYILEFGHQYIRIYRNQAQVLSGGLPVEVPGVPYLSTHLFELKMVQSYDVLYIVHPNYPPHKLSRTSHTNWTLTPIAFKGGPFLTNNWNGGDVTLATSYTAPTFLYGTGSSGNITIYAHDRNSTGTPSTAGINGGAGFNANDVGRTIRIVNGLLWAQATITGYLNPTTVNATVNITPFPIIGETNGKWALGAWGNVSGGVGRGWPGSVCFYEERLYFGGYLNEPTRIDGSAIGNYENFIPTPATVAETPPASYPVSFTLAANEMNAIRWLTADEKGLLVGTTGGEWMLRAASVNETIGPNSITAKPVSYIGSANVQPVQAGKSTVYLQRSGRRTRELSYFYNVDGFQSSDLNILSEHLGTKGTFTELAYQKEPQPIVWAVRSDGTLCAMTFEREIESLKVAWHRHVLGGLNEHNNIAAVESVAVIPSVSQHHEEVWVIVKRLIYGEVKRFVECMTQFFDDSVEQYRSFFVDSGLTYDAPKAITLLERDPGDNLIKLTSTAHGFLNGDKILLRDIGSQEGLHPGYSILSGHSFTVSNVTANTFKLANTANFEVEPALYIGSYNPGGTARRYVDALAGLEHLKGQTVSILGDGAVQPDQVVDPVTGQVELASPAATVHVGLKYNSDGQMLRLEAGAADGTSLGKTRRVHRAGILLHRSLGLKLGMDFEDLKPIIFRSAGDPMSVAPPLFTGIVSETVSSEYDFENQLCWRQDEPLPSTVLAVMPQMVTQDRG